METDLIPHQLHLTAKQIGNLMKGKMTNIPYAHMGSKAGETVAMLHPYNSMKLLGAYRKGKGVRIGMNDSELRASAIQGRGFNIGKAFKKLGKTLKGVGKDIGREAKDIYEDVERGAKKTFNKKLGRDIMEGLDEYGRPVASFLIHEGLPVLGSVAGEAGAVALGQPELAILGSMAGQKLGEAGAKYIGKKTGLGLYQTLHKFGIKAKPAKRVFKDIGKATAKIASAVAGEALSAYTGNPEAGAMFTKIADATAEKAIDSGVKKGVRAGAQIGKEEAKRMAIEAVDKMVDRLPPDDRAVAQDALAKKYPNASDLIYDIAEKKGVYTKKRDTSGLFGAPVGSGVRRRGRPRKDMIGTGVAMSRPYKKALKANFSGLELDNIGTVNAPASKFMIDKRVKPSSDEMTLSPYQSVSSPAMNPFVPMNYFQEGGQMKGYGGSGLYMPSGRGLY